MKITIELEVYDTSEEETWCDEDDCSGLDDDVDADAGVEKPSIVGIIAEAEFAARNGSVNYCFGSEWFPNYRVKLPGSMGDILVRASKHNEEKWIVAFPDGRVAIMDDKLFTKHYKLVG